MNDLPRKTITAVAVVILVSVPATARSEPRRYAARAQSLETGELLYTEHHSEIWSNGALVGGTVEYRGPDGKTFALKELSFERDLFAPAFRMIDERDGFQEGAVWTETGLRLFASRGDERKTSVIATPPPSAVVDAGFHHFMRDQLPNLVRGGDAEFSFAVPSYGRFFRFRVSMIDETQEELVRLRMKPANAFLRLLVNPIDLVYDSNGRLLEFEGVTNIPDETGERHLARIVFTYPDDPQPATPTASAS